MGGKKPLRRPLWPPTRATASNYYPLGLDGAGGAAKPLLRAPKKPAPLHGRLPAFSGAVDAFERARKCFLEWRYFFSIILSEFLKNRVALHARHPASPKNKTRTAKASRARYKRSARPKQVVRVKNTSCFGFGKWQSPGAAYLVSDLSRRLIGAGITVTFSRGISPHSAASP